MPASDPTGRPTPTGAPDHAGDVPFRDALDAMQVGVTISDRAGRIVYVNPALAAMHGYQPDELIGQFSAILGARSARQTISTESLFQRTRWRRETLNVRKDGNTFPVRLSSDVLFDDTGESLGIITLCEDISEQKRLEEEEIRSALRDPLTGLASRSFFLQLTDRVMQRKKRHADHRFAVLYLDLDRFTMINESLGHAAGDALLVAVADRLTSTLRPTDVIARIAGDEFAALLDNVRDSTDATRVAQRIVDDLESPFEVEGREIFLTASIGIALGESGHEEAEQYVHDASAAMSRARQSEGPFQIFDRAVHRRATGRLRLETDLRRAIDHNQFKVMYQPIVELGSVRTAGFEALVRWGHKDRGIVSPGEFIPVAEETGLIVPIGSWVLRESCRQLSEWRGRFPSLSHLTVNVNLSARHLKQPDVVEEVMMILGETGLLPNYLKLEITETMLMEEAEAQVEVLNELRRAGIGVAIDDFGTGYSSLSYLRQFSVDSLKIDRSFLVGSDGEESWEIVQMIIALARGMGVTVVAEGVETEDQKRRLTDLGCDRAQGYLFARPLDAEAAGQRLEEEAG